MASKDSVAKRLMEGVTKKEQALMLQGSMAARLDQIADHIPEQYAKELHDISSSMGDVMFGLGVTAADVRASGERVMKLMLELGDDDDN
jgi:hypothetical protein